MIFKLFTLVVLSIFLVNCADSSARGLRSQENILVVDSPTPNETPEMQYRDQIISRDYSVAVKGLEHAVAMKDRQTISVGLKSTILSVRIKTVEAISSLEDPWFVADLVAALESNQSRMDWGSEMVIRQQQLNTALIDSLEKLLDETFEMSDPPKPVEIEKVIKRSKAWLRTNSPRRSESPER